MLRWDQAAQLAGLRAQQYERERASEPLEMEAIEQAAREAEERLPSLRARADSLAPEAAVDSAVRETWRQAAMAVRDASRQSSLVPTARAELQRRQKARAKVEKERQPHVAEAERLMAEKSQACRQVDKELATAFESFRELDRSNTELEAELRRAGRYGMAARMKSWQIESGVAYAAMTAGLPHGALRLETFSGAGAMSLARARPLAELLPKPIEPAAS